MKHQKLKLVLKSWKNDVKLTIPIMNVQELKVRWMQYQTGSAGNGDIQFNSPELGMSGYYNRADASTDDYFFSAPLDPQLNVVCLFSNFTEEYDITFNKPRKSIDRFTLNVLIDDAPAIDITAENPLIVEFMFR